MFQETWKAGSEVRGNEGITFLEHGLETKVCLRGSQGVAVALRPEARKAWERAGSLRLTFGRSANPGNTTHHHGPAQAPSQPLPRERIRPGHQPIARRARQEPAIQRKKSC